ncbi:MAG: hypothetical protein HY291_14490 [Planctomycetes bacterium]|nr:hypothetical protein [Planctomycetota bacterium]
MWATLGFIAVVGLAAYGVTRTARLFLHGEHGLFIFKPLGAALYLSASVCAFMFYLLAERAYSAGSGSLGALPLIVVVPVLVFPYGIYLSGLAVEVFAGFFNQSASQGELRTYDRGDAALARKEFAQAIACFRQDLARWPGDTEAYLRLARALECHGQAELAASELSAARLALLNGPLDEAEARARPAISGYGGLRRDRNERVLTLTYALGDLYEGPLRDPERARHLYEESLQRLYGYPNVDPLRERLRRVQARQEDGQEAPPLDPAAAASGKLSLD